MKYDEVFTIKIIQSGELKTIPLIDENLKTPFKEIYFPIIKELKLKHKDVFLCNDAGKALTNADLDFSLSKIHKKYGNKINLYYEKIM
ncbi:MAG: hypothetical protein ACFFHV_22400 [Promethearchaeota archaeon]